MLQVINDVLSERMRQDDLWGEQNHLDGTHPGNVEVANQARAACEEAARNGEVTWLHILLEEVMEASAETDPNKLRVELVQVCAVAFQWIQAIDRRNENAHNQ